MKTATESQRGTRPEEQRAAKLADDERHVEPGEVVAVKEQPLRAGAGHDGDHGHEETIPADLKKPSTLAVIVAMVVFVGLLAGLFVVGWLPHVRAERQAEADAAENRGDIHVPVVQVVQPKPGARRQDYLFPCDVKANQDTYIFPRANGYLKKLYVDIQDKVKAGQLMAEIAEPEVDAQLNQSRANLEHLKAAVVKAQSDLDLAQTTLKRYTDAQKTQPGSVTMQDIDEKQSAVAQAQSAVAQAKADVVAGEADVQRLVVLQGFEKVTAPFDGVVTSRNYDVGALLSPTTTVGSEMFRVTQSDVLRVFVNVPQEAATKIQVGQPAYLEVKNYPGREFKGMVARSSEAVNPVTRTLALELHFPNPKGELYAGMYGQAKLFAVDDAPLVTIPTSTLVYNADGLQVAVVRAGKVHFQPIKTGRDFGREIEVTEGLKAGEQIVANPGTQLAEGGPVRIVGDENKAQPAPRQATAGAAAPRSVRLSEADTGK